MKKTKCEECGVLSELVYLGECWECRKAKGFEKRDAADLEEMENVAHENKWKDKNGNYIGGMPQL